MPTIVKIRFRNGRHVESWDSDRPKAKFASPTESQRTQFVELGGNPNLFPATFLQAQYAIRSLLDRIHPRPKKSKPPKPPARKARFAKQWKGPHLREFMQGKRQ